MDVTGTATTTSQSVANSQNAAGSSLLSSDFQTFLRMMTTQMQNQDPLNPVDATDYTTQLATFSSVEQQVLTNDLLRYLTASLTDSTFQELASWIGMQALSDAPVYFDGAPIVLRPEPAPDADSAKLVVTDASGATVQTVALDLSDSSVRWEGMDETGGLMDSGVYHFTVESYRDGEVIDTRDAQAFNPILEARLEGNRVMLTLSDGSEIDAWDVMALRSGAA